MYHLPLTLSLTAATANTDTSPPTTYHLPLTRCTALGALPAGGGLRDHRIHLRLYGPEKDNEVRQLVSIFWLSPDWSPDPCACSLGGM